MIPSIVVVDDDQATRESLDTYLRSAGMAVQTFSSAENFLHSPMLRRTDCLISDLQMPGKDGLSLARDLVGLGCHFPIIILTAHPSDRARQALDALGIAPPLEKPVDGELMLRTIHRALASRPVP